MPVIAVEKLTPGETGLSLEAVQRHRATLAAGRSLAPIDLYAVGSHLIVRDGNNRVRAFIEHHAALGLPVPEMEFVWSIREISPTPLLGFRKMAAYYGNGINAFLGRPVAEPAEYGQMQAREGRRLFDATPDVT
jgi:hypothetical protein